MKKPVFGHVVPLNAETLRNRTSASKIVNEAVDVLRAGGLVIMPTETTYAIAVDATNEEAVQKVFQIKKRPTERAIPILVSDHYMIEEYAQISDLAKHLMNAFMPGPLSLVVPYKDNTGLAKSLSAKGVSFRIPGDDIARAIVADLEKPITTTSANISGSEPLYMVDQVKSTFSQSVNLIMDRGDLPPRLPSTVLDLQGAAPVIVRQGPIPEKELWKVIEEFKSKATAVA